MNPAWRTPMLAALAIAASACTSTRRVDITTTPAGAKVILDGKDTGQSTPTELVLDTRESRYEITLEKAGYNPYTTVVKRTTDVDVIEADRLACAVCCSPCCLGLPLLD